MSAASVTLRGRRAAERIMVDACAVDRQRLDEDGSPVLVMDPVTLAEVPVWDSVWSGKCRVQRPSASVGNGESVVGEHEFGVDAVTVQAPIAAAGIKRGDRVTVTAVGSLTDPDELGLVATVKSNLTKTHATKRTLICEEVSP